MVIRYEHAPRAAESWRSIVEGVVTRTTPSRVCEVGGGAHPALSREFVTRHGLEYLIVDVSAEELAKAPEGYAKLVGDVASPRFELPGEYDFVFSVSVAEHISGPELFHRNVFRLLVPGGWAFHFFSTLYALPFVANRLLPEWVAERLLRFVQPGREPEGSAAKFPALYRWCRGPTRGQLARFEEVGFRVEEYVGYFGHGYFAKLSPLQALEDRLESVLVRHPVPLLTSYSSVLMRKPG